MVFIVVDMEIFVHLLNIYAIVRNVQSIPVIAEKACRIGKILRVISDGAGV